MSADVDGQQMSCCYARAEDVSGHQPGAAGVRGYGTPSVDVPSHPLSPGCPWARAIQVLAGGTLGSSMSAVDIGRHAGLSDSDRYKGVKV